MLQFALGGDVKPKLIDQGNTLQLITPQGKKLRYEGLKAWDAKGRDLNATLQRKDKTLQLQVAVVDAVYPITIDPWLMEEQKLAADDAAANDWFDQSVALSGDTALVGAYLDNDGGSDSGSTYTFDLSCNTTYTLPTGQWSQISLTCDPGASNTVAAVFGDDALGVYATDWVLYRYSRDGDDAALLLRPKK